MAKGPFSKRKELLTKNLSSRVRKTIVQTVVKEWSSLRIPYMDFEEKIC